MSFVGYEYPLNRKSPANESDENNHQNSAEDEADDNDSDEYIRISNSLASSQQVK